MRALRITPPGSGRLVPVHDEPTHDGPPPGHVVVRTAYAGVNRADLLQAKGLYPAPPDTPGDPDVPGLEVSGVVVDPNGTAWKKGQEVCALLAGGGYADTVTVPGGQLLPVPAGVSLQQAAALPEAAATVVSTLGADPAAYGGRAVLIHGGTGGIGSFAVQFARAMGARVLATVGSQEKADTARSLGAEAINYRTQDFVSLTRELTGGRGADLILDVVGAAYLERNLRALAPGGTLAVIGLQKGARAELDLGLLLSRRLSVEGTTLRSRSAEEKAAVVRQVRETVWPLVERGRITPLVSRVFPWERGQEALDALVEGRHQGKMLLDFTDQEA